MNRSISIDPVTRIEGHARVFINVNEAGGIENAGLVVNELRGFEKILVGMEADRMPLITARICGVCPTAHHLAASRAQDYAAGVDPTPAAHILRELMYMGHLIHSHCLSLFALQGPDLVLGLDADPAIRNIVGVVKAVPEIAKKALRCRTIGQQINELIGGRGTHPVTSIAGGITFVLDGSKKRQLESWIDEALALVNELAPIAKQLLLKQLDLHPKILSDWVHPTWSLGTVENGTVNLYKGKLRIVDEKGVVRSEFATEEYDKHLRESVVDWSYMKQVHIQDNGQLQVYRVGPMGRLNASDWYGTPIADAERKQFVSSFGTPSHHTVLQVYARVIELIHVVERAKLLIADPDITGETRKEVRFRGGRGVGHVEAPRGTLIHDYEIDSNGIVRAANLIVATQHNYCAINTTIAQAAETFVAGRSSEEALLNAVEFGIRCFDPCLSCATHAMGQIPLEIIVKRHGTIERVVRRMPS
jgi:F420-non-reducing hydrogenase large subunit